MSRPMKGRPGDVLSAALSVVAAALASLAALTATAAGPQATDELRVDVTSVPLDSGDRSRTESDALVPGTRYHGKATVRCEPRYTQGRQCEAGVVRRGADGTATVELRWEKAWKRRILFVKGRPESADVPQAFTFSRNERGDFVLVFDGDERFEIPKALVFGG